MIIQSNLNPIQIRVHCMNKGWSPVTVTLIEPGTLENIPYNPNHPHAKEMEPRG